MLRRGRWRRRFVATDYSKDPETWMRPMKEQKPTKVVEIPGSWNVDDWRKSRA